MALRNILTSEEKLLHKHCREVTSFDDRLHTLLDDMRDTLMQADGVGLAAPCSCSRPTCPKASSPMS